MRLVAKLYIAFGMLLIIAIGGGSLAVSAARDLARHIQRYDVTHRVLESYLMLSRDTHRVFIHFSDPTLIGDRNLDESHRGLPEAIRADLAEVRRLTDHEVKLKGDEDREELDRLALIETRLDRLLVAYQAVIDAKGTERFAPNWARLSRMLDSGAHDAFIQLIDEAIEEERREVRVETLRGDWHAQLRGMIAWVFMSLAILATAITLWWLLRDLRRPIGRLLEGAAAVTAGRLDHRIDPIGPPELTEVAEAFNRMPQAVSERRASVRQVNTELENAVASRTAELERLLATFREGEANRRRMLAEVSHELRTPLTVIRGEADIALRGGMKPADTYREALEKTRDAALHTTRLVDDLLLVARREAGEIRLKLESADLVNLLPEIVDETSSLTKPIGCPIVFETDLLRADLAIDVGRIRQVIVILIENAVRYGGVQIVMKLVRTLSGYAVSVSDSGPGMSENEQARAFERFYRGTNASANYAAGAGLGLPVARAIVEAHGGEIGLDSQEQKGLTVTFTLPAR